jgi:hypothetical protein
VWITLDGRVQSHQALRLLRREDRDWKFVQVRRSQYLSSLIEQESSYQAPMLLDERPQAPWGVQLLHWPATRLPIGLLGRGNSSSGAVDFAILSR